MPKPQVHGASASFYGVGDATDSWFNPGDFILTHTFLSKNPASWFGLLIRFGQRLRFRGTRRKYAYFNHAAMIVDYRGELVEALGRGVVRSHLSNYKDNEYVIVRPFLGVRDRDQAIAVAERMVGERYGFLTIISIALTLLTGSKFSFGIDGQSICSGLVARAMEKGDAIFDRSPSHIMPADLAAYYRVDTRPSHVPLRDVA